MSNRIINRLCKIAVSVSLAYVYGALSAGAYAQSNQTVTRQQVRAELVQLEKAGYDPHTRDNRYPEKLQAAEARVAQQQSEAQSAYGSPPSNSSQSGRSAIVPALGTKSIYFGH